METETVMIESEVHEVYEKEGVVGNINGMITLFVGLGVISIVIVFLGALGGQTYNQAQPQIDAITDANIKANVKSAIASGFQAQATGAGYLPLLVGAIILIVVIGLLVSVSAGGQGGGYGGGQAL
jgi:hypothetical protein